MTGRVTVMGIGGSYYILCIYIFGGSGIHSGTGRGSPWRIGEMRPDAFPRLKNDGSSVLVPFFSPTLRHRGVPCALHYIQTEKRSVTSQPSVGTFSMETSHADGNPLRVPTYSYIQ